MALSTSDCLFCKIAAGSIPVKRLYEDDAILAFADINPQAPIHLLIIPKNHIASLADAAAQDEGMLGRLLSAGAELARSYSLLNGYRVVVNTGDDGGQTIHHLHLHLLGGRHMTWPPG